MNRDHQLELSHFLRAFSNCQTSAASPSSAQSLEVVHVSLQGMEIRDVKGKQHNIAFDPPLKNLAEARSKMVELDDEARQKLGLGDVTIREFRPARGVDALVFGMVAFYYVCFFTLPYVMSAPSTSSPIFLSIHNFWDLVFPGGIETYAWVVRAIFWLVVAIHVVENVIFARTRLGRYEVPVGSSLWWMWMGTCFFEGVPSFRRFDRLVEDVRAREGRGKKRE